MPQLSRKELWKTVPRSSAAIFFTAVFCTFAAMGIMPDLARLGTLPPRQLALSAAISGIFAVGYAFAATTRRFPLFPLLILAQAFIYGRIAQYAAFGVPGQTPSSIDLAASSTRLNRDAYVMAALIVIAYVLFIRFFRLEGSRFFKAHAEIALAKEIHQQLVPIVSQRINGFEFYGLSVPSGEVGGDLVDVTAKDGRWLAYIADVSGHGVPSGVLMAMVKAATRMNPNLETGTSSLLRGVNKVVFDLEKPNMFVTAACLRLVDANTLEYALAGHLPILHYRAADRSVAEISNQNVPLGMFETMEFASAQVSVAPSDMLLLITDGIAETDDGKGTEFGIERIKEHLRANATAPLKSVVDDIMSQVGQHGRQDDDRSLLLLRRN
jgi:serine phosphatase RsbU (regulator of sigma subunit)